jgi:serine/threonine-protein kinase HipA
VSTPSLDVWLHDDLVARLAADRDEMSLVYASDTVARLGLGGLCLSVALPVDTRPYLGDRVRWWVEGLLPEGESRTSLEDRYEVRRGDSYALVAAIGRDCAGAVSFLDPGAPPPSPGESRPITDDELAASLRDLPTAPLGDDDDVHVSLGGLQAKLLLARVGRGWARPVDGTPSTHILKPDSLRYPGLVASEHFTLGLARVAGLPAAASELRQIDGHDVLVIERFDRRIVDGKVLRLHQEDGAQALGIDPTGRNKYERRAGPPSYASLAAVLVDHGHDPPAHLEALARAMTFVVAIGDTDAHARNHGFLLDDAVALSPLYDVAPAIEFAPTTRLALRVGGLEQLDDVTRAHLQLEARSWGGMDRAHADSAVDTTLESLLDAFGIMDPGPVEPALLARMKSRIERVWRSSRC